MKKNKFANEKANELFGKFGACFLLIRDKDDYELWIRGKQIN